MSCLTVIPMSEFPQLSQNEVYADWTGAALAPVSLLDDIHASLRGTLLGNPHSTHRGSMAATEMIEATRLDILGYFRADPKDYEVIFTSGATSAIRILEHFMFDGGELLMTADNHNSVVGLRETAKRGGAIVRGVRITDQFEIDAADCLRRLQYPTGGKGNRLFAYPAKSNYTGICHDLKWVQQAQDLGWKVLLDAAAFNANNRLDLSQVRPDFVPVSWYKVFGYPTGLGCLLIRKDAYQVLNKRWFTGGAVHMVAFDEDYVVHEDGPARFEDGSVNFANIPLIRNGLRFMRSLGVMKIHTLKCAKELRDRLLRLNVNGKSVRVFSPEGTDVVTFAIQDGDRLVETRDLESLASQRGIYVRAGGFCNPGAHQKAFGYEIPMLRRYFDGEISLEELRVHTAKMPSIAIRASFGYVSSTDDARRIAEFVEDYLSMG